MYLRVDPRIYLALDYFCSPIVNWSVHNKPCFNRHKLNVTVFLAVILVAVWCIEKEESRYITFLFGVTFNLCLHSTFFHFKSQKSVFKRVHQLHHPHWRVFKECFLQRVCKRVVCVGRQNGFVFSIYHSVVVFILIVVVSAYPWSSITCKIIIFTWEIVSFCIVEDQH